MTDEKESAATAKLAMARATRELAEAKALMEAATIERKAAEAARAAAPPIAQPSVRPPDFNVTSVKPPKFDANYAAGWFTVMDAQFQLHHVPESTKFLTTMGALPAVTATRLSSDIIAEGSYKDLKEAVLELYTESTTATFEKLFADKKLTGRASIFLSDLMEQGRRVGVADEVVRHVFLKALPAAVQPVLAAHPELSLMSLGKMADNVTDLAQLTAQPQVSAVEVRTPFIRHPHSRPTENSSPGLTPFRTGQRPRICRGHIFYGRHARTCKVWCEFPRSEDVRVLPNSRPSSRPNSRPNSRNNSPVRQGNGQRE